MDCESWNHVTSGGLSACVCSMWYDLHCSFDFGVPCNLQLEICSVFKLGNSS
jgi:hypothetical protein